MTSAGRGLSRRDFLKIGSLGLGGITLADLLRLKAQGAVHPNSAHKAVIMVYLDGGPSHIDTYDMKPDAPAEYRGEFRPQRTNVPGFDICEHLPLQAKIADKLAVVRGLETPGTHQSYGTFTGFPAAGEAKGSSGRPTIGSVVSRVQGVAVRGMPPYVALGGGGLSYQNDPCDPAYLGPAHKPFMPSGNPLGKATGKACLELASGVTVQQVEDRKKLLASFDTLRSQVLDNQHRDLEGLDAYQAQAFDMITSPQTRAAFDLSLVPDKVQSRYGKATQLLLALRLVQAGVRVVSLSLSRVLPGNGNLAWDHHGTINNGLSTFDTLRLMLPPYDQAIHTLITDMHDRGLDKDVCVVMCGEMGRDPRVNDKAGRDHWGPAGFVLFAGGGLKMGQVIGDTGRHGERAKGRPFTPQQVLATLYHVLGIDPVQTFPDHAGRPMYLLDERERIAELL